MTRAFIFIPPGNDKAEFIDAEGKDNSVLLHELVEGWFECIDLSPTVSMWMNEEGKLNGMPHNRRAQLIWDHYFGPDTDMVMGPVVLTGGVDDEGNTLGLSIEGTNELIALILRAMDVRVGNG